MVEQLNFGIRNSNRQHAHAPFHMCTCMLNFRVPSFRFVPPSPSPTTTTMTTTTTTTTTTPHHGDNNNSTSSNGLHNTTSPYNGDEHNGQDSPRVGFLKWYVLFLQQIYVTNFLLIPCHDNWPWTSQNSR